MCYTARMTIGERVKALRKQRGWSQGQLLVQARRHIPAGKRFARETLSRIENGQSGVDMWIVQALATALHVDVDGLLFDVPPEERLSGAPALPAEVADLAERLAGLPDAVRARLLPVLAGLVALFSADGMDGLSERERLLLTSYGQLPETDQETVLEVAEQMVAAQRATDVSSTGVRRAS